MKKLALFLTGAFLSVSTMGAMAFDGNKTKVEQSELPQEVIQSLEESEYQNWEIQEAYKVKDDLTNEVHYELHLASDADAALVRNVSFSKEGEIIRDEESDFGRTEDQELDQEGIEQGTEPGFEGTQPGMDGETVPESTEPGMQPGTQPEIGQPGTESPDEQY